MDQAVHRMRVKYHACFRRITVNFNTGYGFHSKVSEYPASWQGEEQADKCSYPICLLLMITPKLHKQGQI